MGFNICRLGLDSFDLAMFNIKAFLIQTVVRSRQENFIDAIKMLVLPMMNVNHNWVISHWDSFSSSKFKTVHILSNAFAADSEIIVHQIIYDIYCQVTWKSLWRKFLQEWDARSTAVYLLNHLVKLRRIATSTLRGRQKERERFSFFFFFCKKIPPISRKWRSLQLD